MQRARKIIIWLIILWGIFCILAGILVALLPARQKTQWGVSFDPVYADYLGLNPGATFVTILDDWHFKYVRIPLHWNVVEPTSTVFDFSRYDMLVNEAKKRGVKVVLAMGQKTPRWPECHMPLWAANLLPKTKDGSKDAYTAALNKYLAQVVSHYKNNPTLELWQVENEPFFPFGECPDFSLSELKSEIKLVKDLDPAHPVLVTDSGELSTWKKVVNMSDYFGTTMYRVVWNKFTGYLNYDWLPALYYRVKLFVYGRSPATAFVAELQAEPWIPDQDVTHTPITEQYKSMNLTRLQKNINFAADVGFARTYLWGAEWWAWLEKQNLHEIPDYIKQLPKE